MFYHLFNRRLWHLVLTAGCILLLAFPAMAGNSLNTHRDNQGVWFITGDPDEPLENVFEAKGYAVATDRLWQAEAFRRMARGRMAEIFGSDFLQQDVFIRTTGYSEQELTDGFAALNDETRRIVQGYVDGFNRRIAEVRLDTDLLPFEFKAVGQLLGVAFMPEDWSPEDVLAWTALMLRQFDPEGFLKTGQIDNARLLGYLSSSFPAVALNMFNDLRWMNDPQALTYIPSDAEPMLPVGQKPAAVPLPTLGDLPDVTVAADNLNRLADQIEGNLQKLGIEVKMGSYAWVVHGSKTASGNPIIYSGPQMGFSTPPIVLEGSIQAGGLNISGMTVAGIPGIIIGRTPHHAWSMQVGHAHTSDYYFEAPENVALHRMETIRVAGGDDVALPVFRSDRGPIIQPLPYNPETYDPQGGTNPIVAWKYAHQNYAFKTLEAFQKLARARSMDEFGDALLDVAVSQHFCYTDREGNIAYWMSGREPMRPAGEYRLPQGFPPFPAGEWDAADRHPLVTDRNSSQGYYGGWNNKTRSDYNNSPNNLFYNMGRFHRAHVIDDYLSGSNGLTFEQVRDLALNIAVTDSFAGGGVPWQFVADPFREKIERQITPERQAALDILADWDGRFVAGGPAEWAASPDRADAWMLADHWIREVLRLSFADELGDLYEDEPLTILFNVLLRGLPDVSENTYNWFQNLVNPAAPQTAEAIIVQALDNALAELGTRPWGTGQRDVIAFKHEVMDTLVWEIPFASRSTYAHVVEYASWGPVRIESMFPLGPSGTILMDETGQPSFDPAFFSLTPFFDTFQHRVFPLLESPFAILDHLGNVILPNVYQNGSPLNYRVRLKPYNWPEPVWQLDVNDPGSIRETDQVLAEPVLLDDSFTLQLPDVLYNDERLYHRVVMELEDAEQLVWRLTDAQKFE